MPARVPVLIELLSQCACADALGQRDSVAGRADVGSLRVLAGYGGRQGGAYGMYLDHGHGMLDSSVTGREEAQEVNRCAVPVP